MITLTLPFTGQFAAFRWASVPITGTSDWVAIPSSVQMVSVSIKPAAGETARVEYTLSSPTEVDAGTAIWHVWPAGNVSAPTDDALLAMCIGIRGVASGGTATLEVLAK